LARLGTAATAVGAIAGFCCVVEYSISCHELCTLIPIVPSGTSGEVFALLGVVLLLVSLGTYFGPRFLFYISALAGASIDVIEILNFASVASVWFYVTIALATASLVLGILTVRQRTGVSEQANPMNLPVFG
jgi:hypothetical protein